MKTDTGLISQVWHLSKGVWMEETPEVEFRMLRYPHWRCQLLKPNKLKSIDKLTSFLSLHVNPPVLKHSLEDLENTVLKNVKDTPMLDILFMDPANSPLIFPHNFQMRGDRIRVPLDLGWRIFTIKVLFVCLFSQTSFLATILISQFISAA